MSAIGGYLGLELGHGNPMHADAIPLNLGRHALGYVLRARGYKRVHLPHFTCDVLRPTLVQSGVEMVLYGLDPAMEPLSDPSHLNEDECFLYTNYFGLKDRTAERLAGSARNLVIDNAQSFYSPPLPGVDTFYSCRKFFGVPDGAYLYTDAPPVSNLERDVSGDRCAHLLLNIDQGVEAGYSAYQMNEAKLGEVPMRTMSLLTERLMSSIDHAEVISRRRANRDRLHAALKDRNLLATDPQAAGVPLYYPFQTEDVALRERLRAHRIYTPVLWTGLLGKAEPGSAERLLVDQLVHLPVDQRYGPEHMDRILEHVLA